MSENAAKQLKQNRCIELCGEGGYGNACNALVTPPPLHHTQSVFEQLGSKHPRATAPVDLRAFGPASRALAPTTDPKQVETCIRSFHRFSGAGPSGLKPVHLKESLEGKLWDEIIEHATALVGLLFRGEAPVSLAPFPAGAALTALPKKNDDIRPVAVGDTWRRLTAKCLCATYKDGARRHLFPLQIGVGLPMVTEVGTSVPRQWCRRNCSNPSSCFVMIDFANAFNCVDRHAFPSPCRHHFPGLSTWVEWCYAQPSHPYFGQKKLSSQRGVH